MSIHAEVEHVKMCCKRVELDIAHLRNVIAKMRSYDTDEFTRELELIRKLRERMEVLERKVDDIEKKLPG